MVTFVTPQTLLVRNYSSDTPWRIQISHYCVFKTHFIGWRCQLNDKY